MARERIHVVRRLSPAPHRTRDLALGILGGFVAGFALWSREQATRKHDLFSTRPLRRLAALGYLAGQPTGETVRLLREYVRWETRRDLRVRAVRLLSRVERDLV